MIAQGIRIGAAMWPQYTPWQSLFEAGRAADSLGYDTLWTWDHLLPVVGSEGKSPAVGPIFEAWMTLAAWETATDRIRLGPLVAANTFRSPAMLAKMATALDHISGGRAILGIGAGSSWSRAEHASFGLDYGTADQRVSRLEKALPVIRAMLDGSYEDAPLGDPPLGAPNDPPPVQRPLPLLIGGIGPRMLGLVAQYADIYNAWGPVSSVASRELSLVDQCLTRGRDPARIERTVEVGIVVIRDSREEARQVFDALVSQNGGVRLWDPAPVGTPTDIAELLSPLTKIGYRHLIADFPAPYDGESIARFAREVAPLMRREA